MRNTLRILITLLVVLPPLGVNADAGREGLIAAWEEHMAALPGTEQFEKTGEGTYTLTDTDLPYEGELRLIGALVRPIGSDQFNVGFSNFGMVEFELVDLPPERLASQSYYCWVADRQTLHYSDDEQRWVDPARYQQVISDRYDPDVSFGALSFMLNYGIWVLLIALTIFVFVGVARQARKSRELLDDSAEVNQMARENLEKSADLQKEVLAISRESQDLHRETNRLLNEILLKLRQ